MIIEDRRNVEDFNIKVINIIKMRKKVNPTWFRSHVRIDKFTVELHSDDQLSLRGLSKHFSRDV